jgi:putative spermidine/putrescine transport system substrate-binding protein
MSDAQVENLVSEVLSNQVTRRELARRISLVGISGSALAAALAAREASAAQDGTPAATPAEEIITSPSFQGETLVVTSYGGTWEEFMRAEILPPFEEATGATIELAVGLSTDWMTQLRAAGVDDPPFDVVIANETYISTGRLEGFFEALPMNKVPNLEYVHETLRMPDDIGVLALLSPIGFGYMTEEVEVASPASWTDLPNYLPGVGIYNASNSACAQHIMMMGEVLTGDYQDWEPGFEWIRDNLREARQSDFSGDMETLLTVGEVNVGLLDSPAVARLKGQGIAIEWIGPEEGLLMFEQNTNVTVGSQRKDLSYSFVNYWLGVDVQRKFVEQYFWTPANTQVQIPEELADAIPVTPDNLGGIKRWDYEWLNSGVREEMIMRWNREMSI